MSVKRKLAFNDADAVAGEVKRLRVGYTRAGNWTLPQVCWHLNMVMTFTMRAGPHAAVEVGPEANAKLAKILEGGEIVGKIEAPERVVPPVTAGEGDVEAFLATLEKFKVFAGPFAPHRLFGEMGFEEYRRLHLIHCGHHLGFLAPDETTKI